MLRLIGASAHSASFRVGVAREMVRLGQGSVFMRRLAVLRLICRGYATYKVFVRLAGGQDTQCVVARLSTHDHKEAARAFFVPVKFVRLSISSTNSNNYTTAIMAEEEARLNRRDRSIVSARGTHGPPHIIPGCFVFMLFFVFLSADTRSIDRDARVAKQQHSDELACVCRSDLQFSIEFSSLLH